VSTPPPLLVPDVAPDQGEVQLADLLDQGLETLMFLHPFLDLIE
jgi:hypothetical protein